jgi:hypothetical protein
MNASRAITGILLTTLLLTNVGQVLAHGMDLMVSSTGEQISGQVVYSDGRPGAGDFVSIENLTDPQLVPLEATTDADGRFTVIGVMGNRYTITVHGEEGHTVQVQWLLGSGVVEEGSGVPFYLVAGALLLLSIFPARYLSRRSDKPA